LSRADVVVHPIHHAHFVATAEQAALFARLCLTLVKF